MFLQFFSQFDLVCDRGSLGFVSASVIFIGFIVGSVSVSTISDKFGRKLPMFACGFFCCVFHFVSAFAPAFWVFALFRAIVGFMIGKQRVSFFCSCLFDLPLIQRKLDRCVINSVVGQELWTIYSNQIMGSFIHA